MRWPDILDLVDGLGGLGSSSVYLCDTPTETIVNINKAVMILYCFAAKILVSFLSLRFQTIRILLQTFNDV